MDNEALSAYAAAHGIDGDNQWWPKNEKHPEHGMERMTALSKSVVASADANVGIEIVRYDTVLFDQDNNPNSVYSEFGLFLEGGGYLPHQDAARVAEALEEAAYRAGDME